MKTKPTNSCSKYNLQWKKLFLECRIMRTMGMAYLQYWMNEEIVGKSFLVHLTMFKGALCVTRKIKEGDVI